MVDDFAARFEPVEKLRRAVDGGAFLVARNEQADRALERTSRKKPGGGGGEGRDGRLHVGGAAAIEDAVVRLRAERIEAPQCRFAGWNDVGVTRKTEIRRGTAEARIEILNGRRSRLFEPQAMAGKAKRLQGIGKKIKSARVLGRNRGATDQFAR